MITFTKHSDLPLTYRFNVQENLNATYQVVSTLFTPDILENSAKITLNLEKITNTPSALNHSFFHVIDELDSEKNIVIKISTADNNGNIITHQESSTHIQRPIPKKRW